jgi:hypothetical protein
MRTDGLKLQQSQDLTNLNLTNISRSLDGQNQARQKEIVDQGFSNLKPQHKRGCSKRQEEGEGCCNC